MQCCCGPADLPVEPRDGGPDGEGSDWTHQVDHLALLGAAAPVRTHTWVFCTGDPRHEERKNLFCVVPGQEPRVSLPGQQLQGRLTAGLGHGAGAL